MAENKIPVELVKKLRDLSGCGMMDCKKALEEARGDLDNAMAILRKANLAKAEAKAVRTAAEGRIGFYQHHTGKGLAAVEVHCETDFAARTPNFQEFLAELCQHIYASSPQFVSREQVPADRIAREKEIYTEQVKDKKPQAQDKIIEGKLDGFYKQVVLLEQSWVKDDKQTVEQVLKQKIAQVGENIVIRRFVRLEVGTAER